MRVQSDTLVETLVARRRPPRGRRRRQGRRRAPPLRRPARRHPHRRRLHQQQGDGRALRAAAPQVPLPRRAATATTAAASAWAWAPAAPRSSMDVGCIVLPFTVPKAPPARHLREPPRATLRRRGPVPDRRRRARPSRRERRGVPDPRRRDLRAALPADRARRRRGHHRRPRARARLPARQPASTPVAYYNEHAARGRIRSSTRPPITSCPLVKPPFAAPRLPHRGRALHRLHARRPPHRRRRPSAHARRHAVSPASGPPAAPPSGLAAQGYSSGLSIADATFFGRRAGRCRGRRGVGGAPHQDPRQGQRHLERSRAVRPASSSASPEAGVTACRETRSGGRWTGRDVADVPADGAQSP